VHQDRLCILGRCPEGLRVEEAEIMNSNERDFFHIIIIFFTMLCFSAFLLASFPIQFIVWIFSRTKWDETEPWKSFMKYYNFMYEY
jgi:hypothetical protein